MSEDVFDEEKVEADTVIILSSELIAEVMESYFNKDMFKKRVKVVDLKSTETGYMFSVAFVPVVKPYKVTYSEEKAFFVPVEKEKEVNRGRNGQFTSGKRDKKVKSEV